MTNHHSGCSTTTTTTRPVPICYLDVWHGQPDQEVHEDDADEDDEEEDHEVAGEGEYRVSVLVDEILVLNFSRHHDQSLKWIILAKYLKTKSYVRLSDIVI